MPYIVPERREELQELIMDLSKKLKFMRASAGDLNYVVTRLMLNHIDDAGLNYSTINDLIGMLECSKMELYRRVAAPYENQKIFKNGDVEIPK